ncbi:MAG: hypothetical protein IH960_13155 [Chloroflexi bacterium]|nr:hypothetical protein [Chloroflexota bacterium]
MARQLRVSRSTVSKWNRRYVAQVKSGLYDCSSGLLCIPRLTRYRGQVRTNKATEATAIADLANGLRDANLLNQILLSGECQLTEPCGICSSLQYNMPEDYTA